MLSIESMLEEFFFRVELIQNSISVFLVASGKYDDLELFGNFLQKG
jgi:hypothetical protein